MTRDDSGMRRAQMERQLKGKIRKTQGLRRSGGPGEVSGGRAGIKHRQTCWRGSNLVSDSWIN